MNKKKLLLIVITINQNYQTASFQHSMPSQARSFRKASAVSQDLVIDKAAICKVPSIISYR